MEVSSSGVTLVCVSDSSNSHGRSILGIFSQDRRSARTFLHNVKQNEQWRSLRAAGPSRWRRDTAVAFTDAAVQTQRCELCQDSMARGAEP